MGVSNERVIDLPKETSKAKSEETQKEVAQIAAQISFKVMLQILIAGEGEWVYQMRISYPMQ